MLLADTHFGHRESAGIVVNLFWSHDDPGDRFRIEVQDTREQTGSCSARRRGRKRSTPSTTRSHRRQPEPASRSESPAPRRGLTAAISLIQEALCRIISTHQHPGRIRA